MKLLITIVLALCFEAVISDPQNVLEKQKKEERTLAKLPPCSACKLLVSSFERGIERTSRGKFEGGDAAWEEKNQGKGYATSEVRFVEIQEKLCTDVDRGQSQCHDLHHEWEEHLEEWWNMGENKPDLKVWLCVEKLKVCCADGYYGAECKPCSKVGNNGKLCSGRGKCKGSGTRKGNGQCQCDKGFGGQTCDQCAQGYFQAAADSDNNVQELACKPCHKSCLDRCTGPGPTQCLACKKGYLMDTEQGCHDQDECAEAAIQSKSEICATDKFCVNTEGSYQCQQCDSSCASCTGDGPDSCQECAKGYVKSGDVCMTEEAAGRIFSMTNVRYLTYSGLLVATAIIFQRSTLVAGLLGVVVAAYVCFSEYYLQGATGELRPVMA